MGARPWLATAQCELAAVLLERGRPDDAADIDRLLGRAREAANTIGLGPLSERVEQLLQTRTESRKPPAAPPEVNVFRRDGEVWTLTFAGTTAQLRDSKGLNDIARLLAAPGTELPAADLVGPQAASEAALGADEVLDEHARAAYRRRLGDLDAEIDEADAAHDLETAARARAERDALVTALTAAYGLGRRPRRLGDPTERARKAVTWRIREALRRIQAQHPTLGQHLHASIHTGATCAYQPHGHVSWDL